MSRPDYDSPLGIVQTDADTGDVIRSLPADTLDDWNGLAAFLEMTVMDSANKSHQAALVHVLPERVGAAARRRLGPALPTYPTLCADGLSFFTKGMVWGLDSGWASPAFD